MSCLAAERSASASKHPVLLLKSPRKKFFFAGFARGRDFVAAEFPI